MPGRTINIIVVHCSASLNGVGLRRGNRTAGQVIDQWHRDRRPPFHRAPAWIAHFNPQFASLGYHHVIDVDGMHETGRHHDEIGAHCGVEGRNHDSLGVVMVGTDRFTLPEWAELRTLISDLRAQYPRAAVCGHRDLSPDLDHDGKIEPREFVKICPGFDVATWLANDMQPIEAHLFQETHAA